jgi:hypothetical protein
VFVKLDGQDVGYSKTMESLGRQYAAKTEFQGFVHTNPSTGHLYYKAFKFASLKPAAGAATVEHPDQIQAGRIEVTWEQVMVLPGERETQCIDPSWGTDAANKKLPEGELQGRLQQWRSRNTSVSSTIWCT